MRLEHPGYLSTINGRENKTDLSTVNGRENKTDLSTVNGRETGGDLSTDKIDQRRRKLRISLAALLREARVNPNTWHTARAGRGDMRRSTLERLDRALGRLVIGERSEPNRAAIKQFYLFVCGTLARRTGVEPAPVLALACDFSAEKPQDATWLRCARVRRVAMYYVACEMALGNAALANVIGCSRAGVKKAVSQIEELRERDATLDALLGELAQLGGVR